MPGGALAIRGAGLTRQQSDSIRLLPFVDFCMVTTGRFLRVGLALLLAAGAAQGQIHRCERDGSVSYSDRPCEAGAKSSSKTYAAVGPTGALDLRVSVVHYDVRGLDYPSLLGSLRVNGPKGFHGLAKWGVAFDNSIEPLGDDCAISAARVRVTGEILMPRWVDARRGPTRPPAPLERSLCSSATTRRRAYPAWTRACATCERTTYGAGRYGLRSTQSTGARRVPAAV